MTLGKSVDRDLRQRDRQLWFHVCPVGLYIYFILRITEIGKRPDLLLQVAVGRLVPYRGLHYRVDTVGGLEYRMVDWKGVLPHCKSR